MFDVEKYTEEIFRIESYKRFQELAYQAFKYQLENCKVFREYHDIIIPLAPKGAFEYTYLPIGLFKTNKIVSEDPGEVDIDYKIFTSSATTSMVPSKHYVRDLSLYEKSFTKGFENFYGPVENYNLLALLPSYLEREGSSLVYMADKLIAEVKRHGGEGGFYLYNHKELLEKLLEVCKPKAQKKTILLGVSFALLDFAAYVTSDECFAKEQVKNKALKDLIIMETGGMKGRGKELSRKELHGILSSSFHTANIHSEYGMAELLSQCYCLGGETFATPPWMSIVVRDLYNPLKISAEGKGAANIIDLANVHSCCFIETDDIVEIKQKSGNASGTIFKISGRVANSDLRGCNMLLE